MGITKELDQHKRELMKKKDNCMQLTSECRATDEKIATLRKKIANLQKKYQEAESREINRKKKFTSSIIWRIVIIVLLFICAQLISHFR